MYRNVWIYHWPIHAVQTKEAAAQPLQPRHTYADVSGSSEQRAVIGSIANQPVRGPAHGKPV